MRGSRGHHLLSCRRPMLPPHYRYRAFVPLCVNTISRYHAHIQLPTLMCLWVTEDRERARAHGKGQSKRRKRAPTILYRWSHERENVRSVQEGESPYTDTQRTGWQCSRKWATVKGVPRVPIWLL